ncbi:hypothetical protein DFH27DRAFT_63975 [Peziza echinospora]|nr:hypothetical protein DFH27DRAFT_63975 [Peziza echinospora]
MTPRSLTGAGRLLIKRSTEGSLYSNCTSNIALDSPNSFHPNITNTIWANCCPSASGDLIPPDCRPIEQYAASCPAGYYSCADSRYHAEMCSIKHVDSQDGSGVFGYGEYSRTTQQKCCPLDYSCGGSFDAPCKYIDIKQELPDDDTIILTNPMYVKKIGVFPGCDEGKISPAAVGGIVAVSIFGMCAIGGFLLWILRKRLFRSPVKQRRSYTGRRPNTKSQEMEDSEGSASTVDGNSIKSPIIGIKSKWSHKSHQNDKTRDCASKTQKEHTTAVFPNRPPRHAENRNGSFNSVHLEPDPQLPSRVLDLAGITVTREVEVHVGREARKPDYAGQQSSRKTARGYDSSEEYLDGSSAHNEPPTSVHLSRLIPGTREPSRVPSASELNSSITLPPIALEFYPRNNVNSNLQYRL